MHSSIPLPPGTISLSARALFLTMTLARAPAACFAVALLFGLARSLLLGILLAQDILLGSLHSDDEGALVAGGRRPCGESSAARDRLQRGAAPLAVARAASAARLMALLLSWKPMPLDAAPPFLSPRRRFLRIACLNFLDPGMPTLPGEDMELLTELEMQARHTGRSSSVMTTNQMAGNGTARTMQPQQFRK